MKHGYKNIKNFWCVKIENNKKFIDRVENDVLNKLKDTANEADKKKFFDLLENIRDMYLLYKKIVEFIIKDKWIINIENAYKIIK